MKEGEPPAASRGTKPRAGLNTSWGLSLIEVLLVLMAPSPRDNPEVTERCLRDTLADWPNYSSGQIKSWLERMATLPKKARQRLWVEMYYRIPKKALKYVREWYKETMIPAGREEE